MNAPRPIALVGLRCVGKTSVARALARRLSGGFVDLDDETVRASGADVDSAGALLAQYGEAHFRDFEERALVAVLGRGDVSVIATGGGVIERASNRALLRTQTRCVWLRTDLALLRARLEGERASRPALLGADPVAEISELARHREPLYREVSQLALDVGALAPEAIALWIARELPLGD